MGSKTNIHEVEFNCIHPLYNFNDCSKSCSCIACKDFKGKIVSNEELTALKAENKRLREKMAEMLDCKNCWLCTHHDDIARNAIKEGE